MTLLDGRPVAKMINEQTKLSVSRAASPIALHVLMASPPPRDVLGYLHIIQKACHSVGLGCVAHTAPDHQAALEILSKINQDATCSGILVALPMPGMDAQAIIDAIEVSKDIDCQHPLSLGRLFIGAPGHRPCTPSAVITLLDAYKIPLRGKHAVVVGCSNVVGKPMAHALLERDSTITICNIHTKDLRAHLPHADIIIAAAGHANLITRDMIGESQVLIDIGTNYQPDGTILGDIHPACAEAASHYTPVPGGVGPVTTAMLIAACANNNSSKPTPTPALPNSVNERK